MNFIAGIDYSISSPSLCIMDIKNTEFEKCQFYIYNSEIKKSTTLCKKFDNIHFNSSNNNYFNNSERYHNISKYFIDILKLYTISKIYIEGYSMGSKGLIFNIAENTGILKYNLWLHKYDYGIIEPTKIKKYTTNKGNANKIKMHEAFVNKTNLTLSENQNDIGKSPFSDIIDSYFIALYGYNNKE